MTSPVETPLTGDRTARASAEHRRSIAPGWVFAVPAVILSLYVYYPITANYFFGDDLLNLYRIVNIGFVEFVLRPYAGHILMARNAIFYLCFELFGTRSEYYFYLVLFTHLVNVFLLFRVIRLFTHSPYLACLGAALWGMSPINEGTLGWYSVYGQALVGTGVAWFLYVLGRIADGRPASRWTGVQLVVLLVTTATMFGTGIGVALASPFVAFVLLPPTPARRRLVRTLSSLLVIVPSLYYGLNRYGGGLVASSTQLLSIWDSLLYLFLHLSGNGVASLLLGVFHNLVGYPTWPANLVTVAYVAALFVTFARGSQSTRRQLTACLLFAASGYTMVALGRGPMVAGGVRAEVFYRAARYQYFGPMLMAITLCTMVATVESFRNWSPTWKQTLLAACLSVLVVSHTVYGQPIDHHKGSRRLTLQAVGRIYQLIRQAPGREVYIKYPDEPFRGVGPMLVGKHHIFPGWAALFTIFFPDNVVEGKRVRFVVDNPLIPFADGIRTKDLFVMSEDTPGA